MIEILQNEGNFVAVKLSGRLHDADYRQFVPVIEHAAQKGLLHLLVQMEQFDGWDPQATWEDIRFDAQLVRKIERLAFIGDKAWEAWMAKISKPFTRAAIQSFDANDSKNAWAWIQDGL